MDKRVLILDATFSEEACAKASVTVAVSRDYGEGNTEGDEKPYNICGIYKNGSGSFSPEELLIAVNVSLFYGVFINIHITSFLNASLLLQHARLAGSAIRPHLDEVHVITEEEDRKYPDHPPSRVGLLA